MLYIFCGGFTIFLGGIIPSSHSLEINTASASSESEYPTEQRPAAHWSCTRAVHDIIAVMIHRRLICRNHFPATAAIK